MKKSCTVKKIHLGHKPMFYISTSKRMLAHAFTWLKTIKYACKLPRKYFFHRKHDKKNTDFKSWWFILRKDDEKLLKSVFFIMLMRGSRTKITKFT